MANKSVELLRGTLDMLILRALSVQPTHGYGVLHWIERATRDALHIEEGSLYPALYRLVQRGWIESDWGLSDNNRRARFYRLTRKGRQQLTVEVDAFTRFVGVMMMALETSPTPAA